MYGQETVTISLASKVSIGDYESADLYICVKDVAIGCPQERIDEAMETATRIFDSIKAEFRAKVVEMSAGMSRANREALRAEVNAERKTKAPTTNGATTRHSQPLA